MICSYKRHNELSLSLSLPVLQKLKTAYVLWYGYYQKLTRVHRYTLGERIDFLFIEVIENVSYASFLSKTEKPPCLRVAIRKLDAIRMLLLVLWETKSLDTNKYGLLSTRIEEIGKMLGGWLKGVETKTPAER